MKKVLLLNASEEVLKVINWQHAVKLMATGKAHKPFGHDDEYEIKTVSGVFRLPTALVLVKYVRIPYRGVAVNKENVLRRDKYQCGFCGKKLSNTTGTVDHIVPQSKGGKHAWTNVVAACKGCNNKKDNLTMKEAEQRYGMKLRVEPFVPSRDIIFMVGIDLETHETWSRWVEV